MEKKEKKAKRKVDKVNVAAIIVSIITMLAIFICAAGIAFIVYLLKDKPTINLNDFNNQESTIVYDCNDNEIYELGTVIRQNVEYDDLPESLIDAFIAVEDSRFFEHNGFDIPRFTKALIDNIRTMTFSQGGSTFTMQLIKNTYFVDDENAGGFSKSIKYKVQDIALAIELETMASKKDIFVNYLNKLNFGGTSQNIRGVQKAAQYYFGKDVNDLTLPESAMLAGVINAPYLFNPFNYLEYAQERRDEVLYLMNYHGYITDDEYYLAVNTNVEDFLQDSTKSKKTGEGTPYQAYIDAVVSEVYQLTGLDPYTTSMRIHTCMNPDIQSLMDSIQAGNVDDYFTYPDDEFEVASLCIDNDTGEVVGILGGRNYSHGGALLLNHATDQYKQPGSSIKPILDYAQAFEVLGWSTSHSLVDQPLTYAGTEYIISNATGRYDGQVTLKYAVGMSLNTPAIDTIRQLIKAKGNTYLVDYLSSMGIDVDINDFDEQYGIGGKGLTVSCEQMAAAYAAIMNGGYYTTPHTVRKIEFLNEKAPITPSYQSTQTISEQACFLTSELLKNNVDGGYANLMGLFANEDYQVYAKTGTTNWGTEGAQYNVPNGSIKDGWVVGCTSEYSVATWMGYEKGQIDKPSYMTYAVYNKNIKGKITKLIIEKTVELFGEPEDIQKPSGVTSITHIVTTFPYAAPIDGMDEEYVISGYIKSDSKYANLVSPETAKIEEMPKKEDNQFTAELSSQAKKITLKLSWPEYPDKDKLEEAEETMDISLTKADGTVVLSAEGKRLFDYSWVYGPIRYKASVTITDPNTKKEITLDTYKFEDDKAEIDISDYVTTGSKVKACGFYGYEDGINGDSQCITKEVDDTVVIDLERATTASEIKAIFDNYCSNVTIVTATTTDKKEVGFVKSIILNGKDDIRNAVGTKYTAHLLSLNSIVITEYVLADVTVSVSSNKIFNIASVGDEVKFSATINNYEGVIEWYVDDKYISSETIDSNGTYSINYTFEKDGKYDIEVVAGKTTGKLDKFMVRK